MATTPAPETQAKPAFNVVTVRGRVEEVERYEGIFNTRLLCPAANEFAQPQSVKVRSKTRIGSKDDIVTCTCMLGGYKRGKYTTKPNKDGEVFTVTPVDMTLDLID